MPTWQAGGARHHPVGQDSLAREQIWAEAQAKCQAQETPPPQGLGRAGETERAAGSEGGGILLKQTTCISGGQAG